MSRPHWYPSLGGLDPAEAMAIRDCQGGWWVWGGSICKQPRACVAEGECYFVAAVAQHDRRTAEDKAA